jgi:hypothetical protein
MQQRAAQQVACGKMEAFCSIETVTQRLPLSPRSRLLIKRNDDDRRTNTRTALD